LDFIFNQKNPFQKNGFLRFLKVFLMLT